MRACGVDILISLLTAPEVSELDLEEEGTRIALTVVDTPGFGDQIDNEACFAEVAGYLERQYFASQGISDQGGKPTLNWTRRCPHSLYSLTILFADTSQNLALSLPLHSRRDSTTP